MLSALFTLLQLQRIAKKYENWKNFTEKLYYRTINAILKIEFSLLVRQRVYARVFLSTEAIELELIHENVELKAPFLNALRDERGAMMIVNKWMVWLPRGRDLWWNFFNFSKIYSRSLSAWEMSNFHVPFCVCLQWPRSPIRLVILFLAHEQLRPKKVKFQIYNRWPSLSVYPSFFMNEAK